MFTAFRLPVFSAVLCLLLALAAQPCSAVILQTFDLGLTGTFVHGQDPVSSSVDLGPGFIHTNLILRITATGVPGTSATLGEVPAEILVSATSDDGTQWFSPTVFGPFGASPGTQLEENSFMIITIWPPPVFSSFGEVVIQTNDIYPDILTAPVIEITHASISLEVNGGNPPYDRDGDGFVGITDLNIVLSNWNGFVSLGDYNSGDYSEDGFVGIEDLNLVLANWNAGTPPAATIPEPATLLCLGAGLLSMLRRR